VTPLPLISGHFLIKSAREGSNPWEEFTNEIRNNLNKERTT